MNRNLILLSIGIAVMFASCARSYKVCNPSYVNYTNIKTAGDSINVSYAYDVQFENRNYRYSKKEKKNNMALVAIKIENESDNPVVITKENFKIKTASGNYVPFIDPIIYARRVRQSSELFLLYLFGGVGYSYEINDDDKIENEEVTYNPLFLLIGLGNVMYAQGANAKQRKYLTDKNILNKSIPAKSTFYGLMIIPENNYQELEFEFFQ